MKKKHFGKKIFLRSTYALFSNAASNYWNWGSVAEERRREQCGNVDKVGGDGDGLSWDGEKIRPHPHL
jgi:hypothetical protein